MYHLIAEMRRLLRLGVKDNQSRTIFPIPYSHPQYRTLCEQLWSDSWRRVYL